MSLSQQDAEGFASNYEFWRAALNGAVIGDELQIPMNDPQCGFYRMRRGIKAPWECVAIFIREDDLTNDRGSVVAAKGIVALVDGKEKDALNIWTWCCVNPITEEAYHHALQTGQWGDVDDTILTLQNQDALPPRFATTVPYEKLKQQIDLAVGSAKLYAKITDDIHAMKAQSLRAKLTELAGKADTLRAEEKKPALEQCRLIDGVWQPVIKGAQEAGSAIRRALGLYETAKAAKAALDRANEPLPTKVPTGYGRAAAIRDKTVISEIGDWDALFAHYAGDQRARAVIMKIAEKDVAGGLTLPGVTTKIEKDIR